MENFWTTQRGKLYAMKRISFRFQDWLSTEHWTLCSKQFRLLYFAGTAQKNRQSVALQLLLIKNLLPSNGYFSVIFSLSLPRKYVVSELLANDGYVSGSTVFALSKYAAVKFQRQMCWYYRRCGFMNYPAEIISDGMLCIRNINFTTSEIW
jgi:hypothetical protein